MAARSAGSPLASADAARGGPIMMPAQSAITRATRSQKLKWDLQPVTGSPGSLEERTEHERTTND
jgi:hypothetical protein